MAGTDGNGTVALVWEDHLARYDFGKGHPLAPIRVELTVALIRELGLVDGQRAVEVTPADFDEGELTRIHRPDYVQAVKRVSEQPSIGADWSHGLGPGDNPIFAGMHDASMHVCAASKRAAQLVWEGHALHAFNPAGGLHHAMPDRAAGFCVYNDPAVAIDWLLAQGAERIAYLDVDVHHGDGVQEIFYDDPRVLTVSLHESGRYLFPGTGGVEEIGGDGAEGSSVNVPFHPGTTGDTWLDTFDEVVVPLVHAFAPDVLVTQLGCDTHATDPLAHLALTVDDYRAIAKRLHTLAHETAGGRWVATGGGGYQLVHVVPRAWSTYFAEMVGSQLPDDVPAAWQQVAEQRTGQTAPSSFRDGSVHVSEDARHRTRQAAEDTVSALRRLVLPRHGLI